MPAGEPPSALGLEALLAGRLDGEERERALDRVLADPAGAALLRFAFALESESEALAAGVARLRAPPPRRGRAAWFVPIAAAALLALFLLPRIAERPPAELPALVGKGEASILLADFESPRGEHEPRIFASQFDG